MTDLSPTAKPVWDAYEELLEYECVVTRTDMKALAAALRALAGANAYEVEGEGWYSLVIDVDDIYAIADDLEKQ